MIYICSLLAVLRFCCFSKRGCSRSHFFSLTLQSTLFAFIIHCIRITFLYLFCAFQGKFGRVVFKLSFTLTIQRCFFKSSSERCLNRGNYHTPKFSLPILTLFRFQIHQLALLWPGFWELEPSDKGFTYAWDFDFDSKFEFFFWCWMLGLIIMHGKII